MEFEIIKTERLHLRKLTPEVLKYVFETYPDNSIKDFFALVSDIELANEKEKYHKGISTFNRSFLYFQIIDNVTGQIMGWCGYHTWYTEHQRAELGYVLTNEDYRKKGFMSEALKPVVEYGFEIMNLHRIEAYVGKDNIPSLKLLEKMKFTNEGLLREHYFKNAQFEDSSVFSLLRSEYVF